MITDQCKTWGNFCNEYEIGHRAFPSTLNFKSKAQSCGRGGDWEDFCAILGAKNKESLEFILKI